MQIASLCRRSFAGYFAFGSNLPQQQQQQQQQQQPT